ncbi:MAG: hypothetical protein GTN69_06985 [Armatimonadetes bacterium]|nr:hypothetical protein [Armatimonadota bacterium]
MNLLLKHVKLFWRLTLVGFKRDTSFSTDLLISTLQFILYTLLFVAFWKAIVAHSGRLSHWQEHELVILTFVIALHSVLLVFFYGIMDLPESIRAGNLDKYLCRPIHSLFMVCFEAVPVIEFSRAFVVNIAMVCVAFIHYGVTPSIVNVMLGFLLLVIGSLIIVLMTGTIAVMSFWFVQIGPLWSIFNWAKNFMRYPVDIFPAALAFSLSWVIPLGLTATYPVMILLDKPLPAVNIFAGAVLLLFLWSAVFYFTSRKALSVYEAFGG